MKIIVKYSLGVLLALLLSFSAFAEGLNEPYTPTRKEWLEISIFNAIKDRTDPWKQGIGFIVWVVEKENTVFVTLTQANGQDEMKEESEKNYVDTIKKDIEQVLQRYEWSKDLKIFVQFS